MEHRGDQGAPGYRDVPIYPRRTTRRIAAVVARGIHSSDHRREIPPKRIGAEAYRYAEDPGQNRQPGELEIYNAIQRYGVQAVYGRPLTYAEINQMDYALGIVGLYRQSMAADNLVTWSINNPQGAALLNEAARLAGAMDNG